MAKSFIETAEQRKLNIEQQTERVRQEIQQIESQIADLEASQAAYSADASTDDYLTTAKQIRELRAAISDRKTYIESLSWKLPDDLVLQAWRERISDSRKEFDKQYNKCEAAVNSLLQCWDTLNQIRQSMLAESNQFMEFSRDPDSYAYAAQVPEMPQYGRAVTVLRGVR